MPTALVVDDNDLVRRSFGTFFSKCRPDWSLELACSGRDARRRLERRRDDVVLMDIHLGDENGLRVAEWARQRYPRLPVVLMTRDGDPELRQAATELGFGFIDKPASFRSLHRLLDQVQGGPPRSPVLIAKGYVDSSEDESVEISRALTRFAMRYELEPDEVDVLRMFVRALDREEAQLQLGVSSATYYRRKGAICRKTGAQEAWQAAVRVLLWANLGPEEPRSGPRGLWSGHQRTAAGRAADNGSQPGGLGESSDD